MGAVRSGSSGPTSASGSAGAAAGVGVAEIKTALNAPAVANAAAAASSPAPTDSMCAKVTLQERESMGVDGDDTYNNNTVGAGAGGAGEGAMDVVEQAVGSADRGASALAAAVGTDTVTRADKHQDMVWSAGSDGNRIGGMAAHIQHSMSPVANAADTTANSSACSSGNMLNAVNTAPVAGGAAQGMEASYAVDVLVMPSPTQAPAPIATSALVPNITSSSSSSAGPNKRKLESSASASASGTASVPPACDDDDDDNLTPEELAWYIKQHQKNSSKMVSLAKNNRRIAQDASDREEAKRKEIYKKAQKGLTIQFRLLPMMKQPQSATSNTQTVVYMVSVQFNMCCGVIYVGLCVGEGSIGKCNMRYVLTALPPPPHAQLITHDHYRRQQESPCNNGYISPSSIVPKGWTGTRRPGSGQSWTKNGYRKKMTCLLIL